MKQIWYHDSCQDGTTAASIALKALPDAKTVAVRYNEPPPPIGAEDELWIVDFSYPRAVMEELIRTAESVVVLDHHKTAEAELTGLPGCHFDMSRCGSTMTWDFFTFSAPWPRGLELVQDRDLWTKLWPEETAVFTAGLGLYPSVPGSKWLDLIVQHTEQVIGEGRTVVRSNQKQMDRLMDNARFVESAIVLNSPLHQSDLGERLLAAHPTAQYAYIWYVDKAGSRINSLRSRPGSDVDVSLIARQYGGGGHKHAAGYVVKEAQ